MPASFLFPRRSPRNDAPPKKSRKKPKISLDFFAALYYIYIIQNNRYICNKQILRNCFKTDKFRKIVGKTHEIFKEAAAVEKENQRIMLTRRLFKETLIEMLREKPIEKISVTELCKRAEINRSTFYAHYSVPKDVLLEIKRDFAAQIAESLRSLDENATPKDAMRRICELIAENANLERIILSNSDDDEATEAAFGNIFGMWNIAAPFVCDRNLNEDARRLVTIFFHQGFFRVIREWIIHEIPITPVEIADIFSDILFNQAEN